MLLRLVLVYSQFRFASHRVHSSENTGTREAVAAELGPDAHTHCDFTDEAQVAAAVDLAVACHGCLDILHNNVGIIGSIATPPVSSLDLADFDRVMAVNTRAVLAGVKHAARVMVPHSSGCILCTASTTGVVGGVASHGYSISKATVIGLVRAVAGEQARHGVQLKAISPHGIPTPLVMRALPRLFPEASDKERKRMVEKDWDEMEGAVPEPENIARAAVYLASDEAKYVTGHNLLVDGGYTVGKPVKVLAR